eukprot:5335147-Prymnesium_polylepis.1
MGSNFTSSRQWVFTPCSMDRSRMSRAVSCASRVSPGGAWPRSAGGRRSRSTKSRSIADSSWSLIVVA